MSKCTCGHIVCVCHIIQVHVEGCHYRLATTGVAIECEHGFDVCPTCDPCTCKESDKGTKAESQHTMPQVPTGPQLTISVRAMELMEEYRDYQWNSSSGGLT